MIEKEKQAEAQIRQFIDERGHEIAAIIIETIQGEGGDNHFRNHWLRLLRRICNENDMLLILDEVQSGMGVTGANWCCQHFRRYARPAGLRQEGTGLRRHGRPALG